MSAVVSSRVSTELGTVSDLNGTSPAVCENTDDHGFFGSCAALRQVRRSSHDPTEPIV